MNLRRMFAVLSLLSLAFPFRFFAATSSVRLAEDDRRSLGVEETENERERENEDRVVPQVITTPAPPEAQNRATVPASPTSISDPALQSSTPTAPSVVATKSSVAFPWAWAVTRAAGLASYVLLVFLSVTGILLTTGALFRVFSPATAWSLHRAIGTVLLVSVITHIAAILFDTFIGLRVIDVFIPFVSPFRSVLVALGIIGFYLLILVLITSLYTLTSHPRFWRTVHALAFPMFLTLFLHGILIGTDVKQAWVKVLYWAGAVVVGLALVYRLVWKYRPVKPVTSA